MFWRNKHSARTQTAISDSETLPSDGVDRDTGGESGHQLKMILRPRLRRFIPGQVICAFDITKEYCEVSIYLPEKN